MRKTRNIQSFILALLIIVLDFGVFALLVKYPINSTNSAIIGMALGGIAVPALNSVLKHFFPDKHTIQQNANEQNIQQ